MLIEKREILIQKPAPEATLSRIIEAAKKSKAMPIRLKNYIA